MTVTSNQQQYSSRKPKHSQEAGQPFKVLLGGKARVDNRADADIMVWRYDVGSTKLDMVKS